MALFTGTVAVIENTSLTPACPATTIILKILNQQYILPEVRLVQQAQQVIQEQTVEQAQQVIQEQTVQQDLQVIQEQTVQQDLLPHHPVREELAKEAVQVVEAV